MLCETNAAQVETALSRLQAGEAGAFDDLVRLAYEWLGKRVAAILRDYPAVRLPSDEILHDRVLGRLRTALATNPRTCEELTRLADRHIRWALRDIVREQRTRARGVSIDETTRDETAPVWLADPEAGDALADFLDHRERAQFHEAAAALPEPLRRVFCLRYYGGLSEAETASDLGVTDRTVRNHWRQAINAISVALTGKPFTGELPRLRREGESTDSPLCPRRSGGGRGVVIATAITGLYLLRRTASARSPSGSIQQASSPRRMRTSSGASMPIRTRPPSAWTTVTVMPPSMTIFSPGFRVSTSIALLHERKVGVPDFASQVRASRAPKRDFADFVGQTGRYGQ